MIRCDLSPGEKILIFHDIFSILIFSSYFKFMKISEKYLKFL